MDTLLLAGVWMLFILGGLAIYDYVVRQRKHNKAPR